MARQIIFPVHCPHCRLMILNWDTAPPMNDQGERLDVFPCRHCGKTIDMGDYSFEHAAIVPDLHKPYRGGIMSLTEALAGRQRSNARDPSKRIGRSAQASLCLVQNRRAYPNWAIRAGRVPRSRKAAGCDPRTVQYLVKNDPEIKDAWQKYQFEENRKPKPVQDRWRKPQMRNNDAK